MNELIVANVNKYARMLAEKKYLQSGYIAVKQDDGIVITNPKIDYENVKEEDLTFVNDKNIETLEGNFRAAAVILYCAVRQDKNAGAAAIVDSDSTVAFSSKRKTLMPILDDLAQVCGTSIKCAAKNVASDVVAALSGQRNVCLLPDAGAVVTGRTLDEVFTATLVLDKACNAEILAESKGGTDHMNAFYAFLEHVVFKLKYSKTNQKQQKAAETGSEEKKEERQTAVVTDEEKKIAQDIKDAGVRLLDENLVQGTWGNIAVRLDAKFMLATPSGIDYVMLQPEQMAKVDMQSLEWTGTNKATSEKGIHAILLSKGDGVNASIHTHPFYGCILAAMNKAMPVPEKYQDVLGKEIPCAKPALPGTNGLVKNVAAAIGDAPACFMAHHGVIVRGKDLDDAFAICRALEDACRDYLTQE
ncbi:MAG: class II aldolase/adducin family protein [Christensenella sp.]|nr:MAG: class II aldolase/adducin family protein [Christensenella sp.]